MAGKRRASPSRAAEGNSSASMREREFARWGSTWARNKTAPPRSRFSCPMGTGTAFKGGGSMAYVTDNELGPGGEYDVSKNWRRDFVSFLKGVDLLIHDAMYTPAELEQHRGWGHSTYEEAVTLAQDAGAKKLVLFHHEPEHEDKEMDRLVAAARKFAKTRGASLEVIAAQEGMKVTL